MVQFQGLVPKPRGRDIAAKRAYEREWRRRWRRARGVPETKGWRTCPKCNERQPHAAFPTRNGVCATCQAAYLEARLSSEERRARHLALMARWRAAHIEEARARNRAYYAANREQLLAQRREQRATRKQQAVQ